MIETTDLKFKSSEENGCSVYGAYCGKNGTSSGWNSWYSSTLAAAIRSNNRDGDCGTVTDTNKFTALFSVWSQRECYE